MKHEWRKKEKSVYLPTQNPAIIKLPSFRFLTITGEGSPDSSTFAIKVQTLFALSYAIKMGLKKNPIPNHYDYTVYPLEGVWDLNEEARRVSGVPRSKDDFVYTLMIRQPSFVLESYVNQIKAQVVKKHPDLLISEVDYIDHEEGHCVQMLHIGSFENEPQSFRKMETYTHEQGLQRESKLHREIYLSDFRKVPEEKLKTILRFKVKDASTE